MPRKNEEKTSKILNRAYMKSLQRQQCTVTTALIVNLYRSWGLEMLSKPQAPVGPEGSSRNSLNLTKPYVSTELEAR